MNKLTTLKAFVSYYFQECRDGSTVASVSLVNLVDLDLVFFLLFPQCSVSDKDLSPFAAEIYIVFTKIF